MAPANDTPWASTALDVLWQPMVLVGLGAGVGCAFLSLWRSFDDVPRR